MSDAAMASDARILVVDDDERIAASVRRALAYEGYKVDVAHNGETALEAAWAMPPDLVILDLMMPGIDGIEVCRRLRAGGDDTAILMLTARSEIPDRVEGLDAGADDYLVKPFAYDELLARVRSLLRRRPGRDAERLSYGGLLVDVAAMEVTYSGRPVELTALEFALLEYFMRNPRIVLSRARILSQVWGVDVETTSNVVDVYVRYLRQKLEAGGEPRLIQTMRGAGYVLRET